MTLFFSKVLCIIQTVTDVKFSNLEDRALNIEDVRSQFCLNTVNELTVIKKKKTAHLLTQLVSCFVIKCLAICYKNCKMSFCTWTHSEHYSGVSWLLLER